MSLGNYRNIVKQTILLYSFLRNVLLMISPRHWYLGTVFLTTVLLTVVSTTVFSGLMNALSYIAIALLFCLMVQLNSNYNWRVKGGIRGTIVLLSLIVMCLIIPQVETNTALFTSPINNLKNHRLS
jgi:hypothetical protein